MGDCMLLGEIMWWSEDTQTHRCWKCNCSDHALKIGLCLIVLGLCCGMCCIFFSHFSAAINCYLVTFLLYEDFKSLEILKTQNVKVLACDLPVFFKPWCWCPAVLQLKLYQAAHYILLHLEGMLFYRQE